MEYRPSSIASHIPDQFPKIYREDGPDFIEFVKAYYEYLDNTSERNFSALGDIDNTLERFLKHYKKNHAEQIRTAKNDVFLSPNWLVF